MSAPIGCTATQSEERAVKTDEDMADEERAVKSEADMADGEKTIKYVADMADGEKTIKSVVDMADGEKTIKSVADMADEERAVKTEADVADEEKTIKSEADMADEKANNTHCSLVNDDFTSDNSTLSKNQLKKLKKKEKWEQVKTQKRKAEKERQKARKRECRERGEELPPTRKQLRHNRMSKSNCKVKAVVDCDFDDYMAEKDIKMLVKQIQYSYSANRRAEKPLQFYCCGVNGKTKERLENIGDYKGWDVKFHSESITEMFEKSSIVYLSSDSSNILETLDEDKVYVIGGLVDHNHHKGLCHKLAEQKGFAHAQLPISDNIDMKTRKVLTVNHVFEILLRYTETKDWQKAFYTVLPQRKGAIPKQLHCADITTNNPLDQTKSCDCSDEEPETNIVPNVSEQLAVCDTEEVLRDESDIVNQDETQEENLKKNSLSKNELQNDSLDHDSENCDAAGKEQGNCSVLI